MKRNASAIVVAVIAAAATVVPLANAGTKAQPQTGTCAYTVRPGACYASSQQAKANVAEQASALVGFWGVSPSVAQQWAQGIARTR